MYVQAETHETRRSSPRWPHNKVRCTRIGTEAWSAAPLAHSTLWENCFPNVYWYCLSYIQLSLFFSSVFFCVQAGDWVLGYINMRISDWPSIWISESLTAIKFLVFFLQVSFIDYLVMSFWSTSFDLLLCALYRRSSKCVLI